jgi:protein-tyrosine-phosphatase
MKLSDFGEDAEFLKTNMRSSYTENQYNVVQYKNFFSKKNYKPKQKILFLSKRGTLRAPLASEVFKKLISKTNYEKLIEVFYRGSSKVYDNCHVDYRINYYHQITGVGIFGKSKFASSEDFENADFIISLDEKSMNYAKLHRIRGYIYPFTFFRPSRSNEFISDPYEDTDDIDAHYRDIISTIEAGCKRIVHSLMPILAYDYK